MENATVRRRSTYHHGDLRHALLQAGLELARQQGPDAVSIREVTRRAGVTPNAAYRHFADHDALLASVCSAAQVEVARAIEREVAQVDASLTGALRARGRFHAVGLGYMRFAQTQPGLFRTAFWASRNLQKAASPDRRSEGGKTPFEWLSAALDELVDAGVISSERRKGAEFLAWSAVHGLATLLIDGPLQALSREQALSLEYLLVDMVDRGLHQEPNSR
ncbi:TetR/AcrR family transcriptional regulator (plasmid) [Deinococcus sp. KNUC1210]|uniref:TetR/AcrR family transcriptional regulator n=1 Tax=Deinococcus sp. KNUC1210 TaxID=2917691 RepID=UPI001EF0837E|nr:TetR/AcrR family transcriptional regulator [Deinococcus sp. KNUC1210]ULH16980.1 TetR/AcrR family transcriptional regulator [Deinococcus sp. KNUC1210]